MNPSHIDTRTHVAGVGGEAGPRRADREQAAWIIYQMKLRGVTQDSVAKDLKVSRQLVQRVVYGATTSARVQRAVATALGYESWMDLVGGRQGVAA